ncbi:MAG: DUF6232 family protein [Jiangellaceae bacterium]
MSTDSRNTRLGSSEPVWRVFYRSAKIIITSRYVEVDGLRIPMAELRGLTRSLAYRYPMVKVAAVTAGVELGIAVPFAAILGSGMVILAGLVSACGMAIGVWGDCRRNPRHMEIHAVIRGQRVVLFGTADQREYGFVWRALLRAVEANEAPIS